MARIKGIGRPLSSAAAIAAATAAATLATVAAASPLLLDWSPAALGAVAQGNEYRNIRTSQHFAENVSFATTSFIDGIDIYSSARYGGLGTPVAITIWADRNGTPGDVLGQFGSALSVIDDAGAGAGNVRKHADFAGFTMLAGTIYWIGMAGRTVELAQTALLGVDGGDGRMAQFSNHSGYFGPSVVGDMAFRLYGTQGNPAVIELPEPGSLPLAGVAGVALLMAQFRRQRRPRPR